ncbi:hypothetical protein BKA63DRAFT_195690 [Paraphoma chrysanthemicola]|nr:hypothetical protein BKA63DRAFT_195690 [Paraphoma chrysanthemicola]
MGVGGIVSTNLKAFDEQAILSSIVSRQARRYLRLLVDKSTDVKAQGGHFGNALQAASRAGHKAVVAAAWQRCRHVRTERGRFPKDKKYCTML